VAFFQGASNIKISGNPSFNVVNGSQQVFDQSRHTHIKDSYNTKNKNITDSYNDNSGRYSEFDRSYDSEIDLTVGNLYSDGISSNSLPAIDFRRDRGQRTPSPYGTTSIYRVPIRI